MQPVRPGAAGCGCIFLRPPRHLGRNKMQPGARARCPTPKRVQELSAAAKSETDDRADVERVLAGDVQAFEGIVRRWQGPLINMAWRYCRDRSRAEETGPGGLYPRLAGDWAGGAVNRVFSTWLFAVAANVFRSDLKRFPAVDVPLKDAPEPSRAAQQHQILAAQLSSNSVRRAVLALPLRYREPVVLFYFHDMDVAAAARTMGLPEGTMKARLSRARALLRRRFPHLETEHAALELAEKEA